jgi:levanbiose-producing levanase
VAVGAFIDGRARLREPVPDVHPRRLRMRALVDRTSVELVVADGRIVHSHRVFPLASDDRLRIFLHG